MPKDISSSLNSNDFMAITRALDKNKNNKIDPGEANISNNAQGNIGNANGVAGTRETADALEKGDIFLKGMNSAAADQVAKYFSKHAENSGKPVDQWVSDGWVSKEDLPLDDATRQAIDDNGDNKLSVKEFSAALQNGTLSVGGAQNRPTPPSVNPNPSNRPTPPSVNPNPSNRPTPPSVNPNPSNRPTPPSINSSPSNRPTPPSVDPIPVHVPRYYFQSDFPMILPNDPRPLPQIEKPEAPAPARQVDLSEVSNDVVDLLAEKGRLRSTKKTLGITTHPQLKAAEAKQALASGKTISLAPDGGMHASSSRYQPITKTEELQPLLPEVRNTKLAELQRSENYAYQQRVEAVENEDIQHRIDRLPAFNSVYDMNRLAMNNYLVSEGGKTFNRNMITAMNIYNQPDTKREIARRWSENSDMSTAEFNRMANSVVSEKVSQLYWNANYQGDWGTQLGTNPVPGLRYPDTQEDVDYNTQVIQQVASGLPMLLNSAVSTSY